MHHLLGFGEIVEQLIQKGADINHVAKGGTALINAAYEGNLHNICFGSSHIGLRE